MKTPANKGEQRLAYVLLFPAFLIVVVVVLIPLIMTFADSLKHYNLLDMSGGTPFVGLQNYAKLLSDPGFWGSLGRTLHFTILSLVIEFILGVAIAMLLHAKFHGQWLLRGLIVIPWAIPTIVNGAMWRWIYNPSYGALNNFLVWLHLTKTYHQWLGSPATAMNMVVIADAWKMIPLVAMLVLAALQLIPEDVYEAVAVDGAGRIRSFFSITLPYLKNVILVVLVIRTIDAIKVFDIIYAMTGGGPANSTMPVAYYAYDATFNQLFISRGAAAAYLIAMLTLIFTIVYSRLLKTEEESK
ncbi:sugar ABC transporter permease [Alicyclobacillaceae bacterium I2511]|nr:sugar ABC transporter permease [Alicyclobacillaceae bacterium I2511]